MTNKDYKNIFAGESITAKLASCTYTLLMSREWISKTQIMLYYKERIQDDGKNVPVSKWKHKEALKDAVEKVKEALTLHFVNNDFIKYNKNRREFQYTGQEENPLGFMTEVIMREEIERFWNFCNDTYSFIPNVWLEYFFKNSNSFLQISNKREQNEDVISTSINRKYDKKELLPQLYEAIKSKKSYSYLLQFGL